MSLFSIDVFSRKNFQLLPPKSPHNFHGKVIKVALAENPPYTCNRIGGGFAGIDIEIIDYIAESLNLKAKYIPVMDLKRYDDESLDIVYKGYYGDWKLILLRTLSEEVNVGSGGLALTNALIGNVGYTQAYMTDSIEFFATDDMELSNRIELRIAFIVVPMALVLICTSLTVHLSHRRGDSKRKERDFGSTALMVRILLN